MFCIRERALANPIFMLALQKKILNLLQKTHLWDQSISQVEVNSTRLNECNPYRSTLPLKQGVKRSNAQIPQKNRRLRRAAIVQYVE